MKKQTKQNELEFLAYKLIPLLDKDKQSYHYKYLVGTLRYILSNFYEEEKRYSKKEKPKCKI